MGVDRLEHGVNLLQVLVLCFAVFLGGFGPTSLNIGYTGAGPSTLVFQQPSPLRPQPNMGPGVVRAQDTSDAYATPNCKWSSSRAYCLVWIFRPDIYISRDDARDFQRS